MVTRISDRTVGLERRDFLRLVIPGAVSFASAGAALIAASCSSDRGLEALTNRDGYKRREEQQSGETREIALTAAVGEIEIAPHGVYRTWLYNNRFPGPEIRVKAGERLRVSLKNELPEGTTIHWHGIPVPNAMDGVPGVTQELVKPGESFEYDFVADPAGSYLYHSHAGLQIDRGLIAPLVVEEKMPIAAYDREYVLMLDDFLPGEPKPLPGASGMMGGEVPPYRGLLINGRLPASPAVFETKKGERIRFRIMNPSGATTFRFGVAGHKLSVIAADGRPVKPVLVDSLFIGMGERYDVIVEAANPGAWTIAAAAVEGNSPPASAVLRYTDAARTIPEVNSTTFGFEGGRVLELADLEALEPVEKRRPDRTLDLTLSGGMMTSAWTINGQAYPNADALEVSEGERVRVRMINHSMMLHPMHLHGHFFRIGETLKDTVVVPPHMGRIDFDFLADNPGKWFFHCHNIYHMESGMARVFSYV
ncbi:MAG TPA: multicopper oxidase family protein [Pyrinomonadaceae bacterium]|nr:multicopper oxidase family protein [Pyrinomonadaceae bacterium]